jgi:hypothetical protein
MDVQSKDGNSPTDELDAGLFFVAIDADVRSHVELFILLQTDRMIVIVAKKLSLRSLAFN